MATVEGSLIKPRAGLRHRPPNKSCCCCWFSKRSSVCRRHGRREASVGVERHGREAFLDLSKTCFFFWPPRGRQGPRANGHHHHARAWMCGTLFTIFSSTAHWPVMTFLFVSCLEQLSSTDTSTPSTYNIHRGHHLLRNRHGPGHSRHYASEYMYTQVYVHSSITTKTGKKELGTKF